MTVQTFLDEMGIRYRSSCHPATYTAQDLASVEHVPGRQVIKPVVVRADGQFVMCALPASYRIDLDALRMQLEADNVTLVDEQTLLKLFPDCEVGAEPPIGRLFDMPTIMDESLVTDDRVMFQAGTHKDAVTMTLMDYRRAAQPEMGYFSRRLG